MNPMYICPFILLLAEDEKIVAARTEYADKFHSAVEKGNVFACQFHPEKVVLQG